MVSFSLEDKYLDSIIKGLNKQLSATIIWLGSEEAQRFFNERSQNISSFWKTSNMREEWDNLTRVNAENSREYIESIYDSGARHGYNLIGKSVGVTLADRETLFHLKNYNYDLIKSLNKEAVQEIRKTLTQAEAEGLHPFETARLLRDSGLEATSGLSPLQRAKVIARTESRRASTAGSVQAYRNYGIEEWDLVTAGDSLVCEDCLDIEAANPHGIRETDLMPPIHPNCRCVVSPVVKDVNKVMDFDSEPVYENKISPGE